MRLSSLRNDPHASEAALQFLIYLLSLEEGRLAESEGNIVKIPEPVHKVLDVDALCNSVFEGLASNHSDVGWLTSRTILSMKNSRLIDINAKVGAGTVVQGTSWSTCREIFCA